MKFHPLCEAFPVMSDPELDRLGQDIKRNGQQYPVLLLDGMILDGRNRWLACGRAGVKPITKDFDGDALALVSSLNIERRHLDESQRAMIAAKLADMPQGYRTDKPCANLHKVVSQSEAAQLLKVSRENVNRAKSIIDDAPHEVAAIERGEKSINEVKRELNKKAAIKRVAELPSDKFRVLYADPPWKYGDTRAVDGWEGTADTFKSVLGDSEYCQTMLKAADELEQAQRDSARLDWLHGHPDNPHPDTPVWSVWGYSWTESVRDAIDQHLAHVPTLSAPAQNPASDGTTSIPEPPVQERIL